MKTKPSARKWLLMDMREQFHIYTPRKSGEIIEENPTFKYKEKLNEPEILVRPNTGGIIPKTQWVIYG